MMKKIVIKTNLDNATQEQREKFIMLWEEVTKVRGRDENKS